MHRALRAAGSSRHGGGKRLLPAEVRRIPPPRLRSFAPLLATLLASTLLLGAGPVLLAGCDSQAPERASGYLPSTSPENVLENYRRSMERLDIEAYARVLHPEFVLAASGGEARAGLEADLEMTRHLFEEVESIALTLEHAASTPSTFPAYPASQGYRQVELTTHVTITTAATETADTETYDAVDRNRTVVFAPHGRGTSSWSIVYWGQPSASSAFD